MLLKLYFLLLLLCPRQQFNTPMPAETQTEKLQQDKGHYFPRGYEKCERVTRINSNAKDGAVLPCSTGLLVSGASTLRAGRTVERQGVLESLFNIVVRMT